MEKNILSKETATTPAKTRSSNLELLRIITMLLIVAHHYVVNSGLMDSTGPIVADPMSWKSMFLLIFGAFGKAGINCFVFITGYFMCKSEITIKKFCKLLFEVEFYNIIIGLIFMLSGYEKFSFRGLLDIINPIESIATEFTSCYLIFFLFIPFLNILIRNLNEKQHIILLSLCVFVYVVLGTIPGFKVAINYVSWFTVLYLISSYIRLYDKKIFSSTKLWGLCTLAMLGVSILSIVAMSWLGAKVNSTYFLPYYFLTDANKVLAVMLALCAFMFFKNVKIPNNAIINTVAASTYGVLLIHANSDTMRRWLWQDTLNNVAAYNTEWIVFHAIGSVLSVYILCTVIDYLRIQFAEKPFFKHFRS